MVKVLGRFYTCVFCLLDSWWRGNTAVKWQLVYSVTERLSAREDVLETIAVPFVLHLWIMLLWYTSNGPCKVQHLKRTPKWLEAVLQGEILEVTQDLTVDYRDTMLLYWTDWQLQSVVPNSELDCSTVARRWSPIRWYDDSDRVVMAATTWLSSHVVLYLRRAGPGRKIPIERVAAANPIKIQGGAFVSLFHRRNNILYIPK